MNMKITYIAHSGFSVELDHHVLLFDYFTGSIPDWDPEKSVLVFASHKHRDHFNHCIFELYQKYPKIRFFLGTDIRLNEKWYQGKGFDPAVIESVTRMKAKETAVWKDVSIVSLKSTDAGVAFVVKAEGYTFYHAGDLHWWHWDGEPDPFNPKMEADFKRSMELIKGMHFDVAFVPLDPRLERAYDWGMNYFLECTETDRVFPMHMWEEYDFILKYKEQMPDRREEIFEIHERGEVFDLWK